DQTNKDAGGSDSGLALPPALWWFYNIPPLNGQVAVLTLECGDSSPLLFLCCCFSAFVFPLECGDESRMALPRVQARGGSVSRWETAPAGVFFCVGGGRTGPLALDQLPRACLRDARPSKKRGPARAFFPPATSPTFGHLLRSF